MSKIREVQTIILKGLNSRDTINNVEDGWCEKLHNVAFREGKFQTMCEHECKQILDFGDYKILYIYPILPEGDYIAAKGNDIFHIKSDNGTVSKATVIKNLPASVDKSSIKISHFESTLFISYTVHTSEFQDAYVYNDEKFTLSGIDTLSELVNVNFTYDFNFPTRDDPYDYAAKIMSVTTKTDSLGNKRITNIARPYETRYAYLKEQDYLHGAIYLFFAYKMKDGSIFRNGRIYMLECEQGKSFEVNTLYKAVANNDLTHYFKDIIGFKVKLTFYNISTIVENRDIKSIIVYSTRNNPMYNFDNLHHDFPTDAREIETVNSSIVRANVKCVRDKRNMDIASSPFYAVAEIDLRAVSSITLSANSYTDIEQKPIYSPTVSPHHYRSKGKIELNRRLHLYNISAQLYKSSLPVVTTEEVVIDGYRYKRLISTNWSEIERLGTAVTLNVNGENVVVNNFYPADIYLKIRSTNEGGNVYQDEPYVILPNMISYPDARAIKLDVIMTRRRSGISETLLIKSFQLQPSAANNYATYRNMSRDVLMFYELFAVRNVSALYTIVENKDAYRIPNQVMVSEVGRPYLFYPQHVYYVGSGDSTKIENANTPIDQLTESRFGQYPLYLFTTSGIYAMEQGVDIIYNNIVKVNTDVIKNTTNSVSAYGALYYFSSAGLMRLNGHVSTIASDVINSEMLGFMDGAFLSLIPEVSELMIINRNFHYAYVYSLRNGTWSSRDFHGEIMSYDTYIKDGNLYNLLKEDANKPLHAIVETRELHLGNRQIKRIDRFKADILTSFDYSITLLASLDGVEWCELSKSENCATIKRTLSSWKYFKIKLRGTDFILDNLIFESFTRFIRHIR